jgi:hypothetical protein
MNILFLTDETLSKEEILTTAKFYQLGTSTKLFISNVNGGCCFNEELWNADIVVTNTSPLTEQMIKRSPNLLLIGTSNEANHTMEKIVAEKKGILMIAPANEQDKVGMASKLRNLQTIFSELERFIDGQPLNYLVKPIYSS